jgi:formylglycine-generating enzyme required for sulfatase activity
MDVSNLLKKSGCFIILFFGLGMFSFAQSKKEQILLLQTKLDSISKVVLKERSDAQQHNLKRQSSIDSLQRELQLVQSSISTIQNELNACLENLNSERQYSVVKKLECEKNQLLKQSSIDSLQRALQQYQDNIRLSQNELYACKECMTLEKQRCAIIKLDCKKIQFQLDSLANAEDIKSIEPELVFVRGGTFQMVYNFGYFVDNSVHSVTLSTFNIGKYEVTQGQWMALMGSNPSNFSGCENCPVESVSWNDVQEYIEKLNARTGKNYRLPTEAEWEFAARGGECSKGYSYSGSRDLRDVAWTSNNSGNRTNSVGTLQANELGIYDMTGNAWEWCSDWYGDYDGSNTTNPTGPSSGQFRVHRGGSWLGNTMYCLSAARDRAILNGRYSNGGFRLVLPVSP